MKFRGAKLRPRDKTWERQIMPMLDWVDYETAPCYHKNAPYFDSVQIRETTYEELAAHSQGCDFTTDGPNSVRQMLYDRREEIQEHWGLYFDDYPLGLRWTKHPMLGVWWRFSDEQPRTEGGINKTLTMASNAIAQVGTQQQAAVMKAMTAKYQKLAAQAGAVEEAVWKMFNRQNGNGRKRLAPGRNA